MPRLLPMPALTALLMGFFCCLAGAAKVDKVPHRDAPLLELKFVHPDSTTLAPLVKANKARVPRGYRLFSRPTTDPETGKKIGDQPILLQIKNIVDAKFVQSARVTPGRLRRVSVQLTKEGGAKLKDATQKMKFGRDRMAVVVEGKCLIAPTVQAALNRDFVIAGLDSKEEAKRIVAALNNPGKKGPKK